VTLYGRLGGSLLLIDDHPGDADLIRELLASPAGGPRIEHAETLAAGLARLAAGEFGVVLLDLLLPDAQGVECVEAVRRQTAAPPIVVLTRIVDDELAGRCLAAGAQDCIAKQHVTSPLLKRAIAYAVARATEAAERRRADAMQAQLAATVAELQRNHKALIQHDVQMRALARRLNAVREDERTQIARAIHDELGQSLTGLKLDLRWVTQKIAADAPPPVITARLADAERLVESTIITVQRLAIELRPAVLDTLGLPAAIRDEGRRFEARSGVTAQIAVQRATEPGPEVATGLFRIYQELLTNVARHARASRVDIELTDTGDGWTLRVEDDGIGITSDAEQRRSSLGLLGMRERVVALGGTLAFERGPVQGTIATVHVPRAATSREHAAHPDRG